MRMYIYIYIYSGEAQGGQARLKPGPSLGRHPLWVYKA